MSKRAATIRVIEDKADIFDHYWRIYSGSANTPEREYEFASHIEYTDTAGRKRKRGYKFDFAFPSSKLAVEVDGGQWVAHGGRHNRNTDREKLNMAAVLGWRVMRYTPDMIERDPVGVIQQVMEAL